MTDWLKASALDMAAGLRSKAISATELLNVYISRMESVNPAVNALAVERFDEARVEARMADEVLAKAASDDPLPPFFGVPCTIKEFLACTGMPHTAGLLSRKNVVATEDATTVARLKAAGAVIMGSTNIPEGGLWMETHNLIYGRTKNPWNLKHTPGGSSGGESALIAAGASPIGLGSDVGGSLRIPAAFCGIWSHKATGGLVPNTGHYPPATGRAGRYLLIGPMGRTVADIRAMLKVLAGPDHQDGQCRALDWELPSHLDCSQLRVIPVPLPGKVRVRDYQQRAVLDAAQALERRGATIEEHHFPNLKHSLEIWSIMLAEGSEESYDVVLGGGTPSPVFRELLKAPFGRSVHSYPAALVGSAEKLARRFQKRLAKYADIGRALQREIEAVLGDDGVLLYPSYTRAAPRHHWGFATPFDAVCTAIFNVMEFPATQCPVGEHKGLPIGVQVVGARGMDGLTLAAAEHLEDAFGGWRMAPHPE